MKKVRTDYDREIINNLEGYENFENWKIIRFFEENSLKMGQPSLKKKWYPLNTGCNSLVGTGHFVRRVALEL
jgi:hypothetical protein